MTMLRATMIHWHNADEVPPDGNYLVYIAEANSFTDLHVYQGRWNCYRHTSEHELQIDAWAELPVIFEE